MNLMNAKTMQEIFLLTNLVVLLTILLRKTEKSKQQQLPVQKWTRTERTNMAKKKAAKKATKKTAKKSAKKATKKKKK